MKERMGLFANIARSGFVRSVFMRVLLIFMIVSVIIAGMAFYSFTSEIRRTILLDRQKQLATVENTISGRMNEITSIAYNIGNDPVFYLEPVANDPTSGVEMKNMLARYLVGNSFIEHLAFCRAAEPDTIYTAKGERSLSEFMISTTGVGKTEAEQIVHAMHSDNRTRIMLFGGGKVAYFTYSYSLPQLAPEPRAHVLMMIPVKEVRPLLETLLINGNGEAAVFDADGAEIYHTGNLDDVFDLTAFVKSGGAEENYQSPRGDKYVLQKVVSETNGWTYVSVMRHSDTLTGLANKQVAFIAFILLLLVAAVVMMLGSIVAQFKPISSLAAQVATQRDGGFVDERTLLQDTIATLKGDSEQKHKYETAYYEAEAASKAKSAFLSSMSHDIRTPMNAIVGMTAIARKHIGDQAYVDECLQKVQVSSDYLLDIINNVLDMSRIESGRIPIAEEPLLIPALIDSLVSLMTSSIEAKSQTLEVDASELKQTAVLGDSVHIVQVFVNILSNAVKFTPEGGRITLRVRQVAPFSDGAGNYVFTFTDTGIGIPPAFIGQVFDTFTRADDPAASRTEGTGLGMAIAKKLVELMGGTIRCESELGVGTTFTVALRMPYADENAALSLSKEAGGRHASHNGDENDVIDLTGKRILLVEDNAMNREIANRILSETGAAVTEANDGKSAVETFANSPDGYFDLIFMDIQMPVMNGYEATAAIRALDKEDAATVPIYAMTANTFDEDVRQIKNAGMNGHIGKPYNPPALFSVLKEAFGA
ncbi:MAG: ATP-binding protein [Eubacteriales bacterium]|nr:ATP-binding protein [Eubacteriales bacterium]